MTAPGTTALFGTRSGANFPRSINGSRAVPAGMFTVASARSGAVRLTPAQVAGRLGVSRSEYLELEAGTRWPCSTVWERMVALYGWPR